MNRGYVMLWRKTLDSGVMQNPHLLQFWIWCLMKASHKKHSVMVGFQSVDLEPGQFVFGRIKAAEELHVGEQTIRTNLVALKANQQLTIKTTNKFSVITICNWSLYQNPKTYENHQSNHQTNQQVTSNQPSTNQQVTTNNNGENGKNGENGLFVLEAGKPASTRTKRVYAITWDKEAQNFVGIDDEKILVWKDAFPAVDVRQQLLRMRSWVISNPKKMKSNWPGFINKWLTKEQDKGRFIPKEQETYDPAEGWSREQLQDFKNRGVSPR